MFIDFNLKAFLGILLSTLLFVAFAGRSSAEGQPTAVTTVYIIRHAEKADNGGDPPLSPEGVTRAEELTHVLADAGIDAVFVTKTLRSRQTGEPIAKRLNLEPIDYDGAEELVRRILARRPGGRILVVAHSNTAREIAGLLGVQGLPELEEKSFDRIFVVHRAGDVACVDRLRYGAPTP